MIEVTVKFLAGSREDFGISDTTISMPQHAVLSDLGPYLHALGVDQEADDIIITLNSRGLRQWPSDRRFAPGDVIAVFPLISGG